jgi:DNA-directed RNA polymerase specialized sigma24 family protein
VVSLELRPPCQQSILLRRLASDVSDDSQPLGGDRFPATRWSVIDAARSGNTSERELALATLCAAYWKPVYKYVRLRWNRPAEDAQDLTQGFFAQLLDRDLLAQYDPAKSRLRTFLRVCADSFVMNQDKAALRQKRGGNVLHVALDFEEAEGELRERVIDPAKLPDPQSMEDFFEKEWIRSLFTLAIDDLRRHCESKQREKTFLMFEEYDLDGDATASYDQLARKFGVPVTDVTNGLSWARREFRRIALERLRELCSSEEEFQREVLSVFGRKTPEAGK